MSAAFAGMGASLGALGASVASAVGGAKDGVDAAGSASAVAVPGSGTAASSADLKTQLLAILADLQKALASKEDASELVSSLMAAQTKLKATLPAVTDPSYEAAFGALAANEDELAQAQAKLSSAEAKTAHLQAAFATSLADLPAAKKDALVAELVRGEVAGGDV